MKRRGAAALGDKTGASFAGMVIAQGLPADFDLPGFTVVGKVKAVGNGVPYQMGRLVARSVRRAMGLPIVEGA